MAGGLHLVVGLPVVNQLKYIAAVVHAVWIVMTMILAASAMAVVDVEIRFLQH